MFVRVDRCKIVLAGLDACKVSRLTDQLSLSMISQILYLLHHSANHAHCIIIFYQYVIRPTQTKVKSANKQPDVFLFET